MPNLIGLYRLQQADNQIEEVSLQLESLKSSSNGQNALTEVETALEKAGRDKREAERILKDAELQLATLENEIRQVENKLFSGKVTNSKELSQLERDGEMLKKKRGGLDDQVLRGMEKVDKFSQELISKQEAFQEVKAKVEEQNKEYQIRVDNCSRQLSELQARRAQYFQAVEETLIEQYVGLKERKGGIAVAKVQKNICNGCNMAVPHSIVQKVKAYELEFCSSCGRILYLDKEM